MKAAQIVLIEDNPADVFLIEMALQESGIAYQLTRFGNGRDALRSLDAGGVAPDAILLDLNTPQSDGFEVLSKIKQIPRLAEVPVAIISSSPAIIVDRSKLSDAHRYIQKPSQLDEFLATVGGGVKEMLAAAAAAP